MKPSKALTHFFTCILVILLLGSNTPPVHSQQAVEFKNHQAKTTFLENIRFTVDLCGLPPKGTATLRVRFSHEDWETVPAFVDKATPDACARGRYTYRMVDYPPFIPIEYYWQAYIPGSGFVDGPHHTALYEDTRYQWQKLQSENITLYWHDRPDQFGKHIFEIAEKADRAQREFFGLELNHPYRIVIFNTPEEYFGWNVDSYDYVAGESYPFFDLTVQIVESDSQDWLDEVIPHEISHLYFNQATYRSRSDYYPPNWLDEGVAVYNEFSEHHYEDDLIRRAVVDGRLIPLGQLAGSFGDDDDRVDLAYAEGYSAVSYIMEVYGRDTLKKLMNSYRRGMSTEEAFAAAMDMSFAEFEADWKVWLKDKYKSENPPEIVPFPTNETSLVPGAVLTPVLCGIGFFTILCLVTLAGVTLLALVLRNSTRT